MSGYFLLPGPTAVPPRILAAGARPMVNHRGPEFQQTMQRVTAGLQAVMRTQNDVITLTASGTGAMEAAVANFVNPGDKVIVASVGNFGDRFRDIAQAYGADVIYLACPWGQTVNLKALRNVLQSDRDIKAVFCQLNETSTGVLNPIEVIGALKRELDHPALLIVDAISGLAATPLDTDAWGIDVVVAGSQKAFMSPPGLSFIAVSGNAWQVQQANKQPKYYFDLAKARAVLAKGQTPYTPAVATANAVAEALDMIQERGLDNIIATHAHRRELVRTAVCAMGLQPVAADDCASPAVTAVYSPDGIPSSQIVKLLHDRFDIVITGGQGKFKDKVFRIGHLGEVNDLDLIAVLSALEVVLNDLGFSVPLGTALAAAMPLVK